MIAYKSIDKDLEWLRKRSREVNLSQDNVEQDIKLLREFCQKEDVFAMAAIQLGIDKRIVYLKNTDLDKIGEENWNEDFILINPVILKREGISWYWEACRSCLEKTGLVLRPYSMLVTYYDLEGVSHEKEFFGFPAVVLSHELDHLDGVLHIDKSLKIYNMNKEERKNYRNEHPYRVFQKTGDFVVLEKEYREKYNQHLLDKVEDTNAKYN